MKLRCPQWLFLLSLSWLNLSAYSAGTELLPIRGLHCGVPGPNDVAMCAKFIREALPKEGVNTLVLEINYKYQFKRHPELAQEGALSQADVEELVAACKDAGVQLIPQFNCLGHQSWSRHTFPLLTKYPEFDESPGKYPDNEGIYCRSYCPLHPNVHQVVFALDLRGDLHVHTHGHIDRGVASRAEMTGMSSPARSGGRPGHGGTCAGG